MPAPVFVHPSIILNDSQVISVFYFASFFTRMVRCLRPLGTLQHIYREGMEVLYLAYTFNTGH